MKKEYEEKLELCKKLLHESLYIESDEIGNKMFDDGYNLMSELTFLKDPEILIRLFDLFTEENENGVCETLESEIFQNHTIEQIIEAFRKKFSELVANNGIRAEHFFGACMGEFEKLRDIFNHAKSPNSEKFLNEFEDTYREDYPEEIAILREDMKKW